MALFTQADKHNSSRPKSLRGHMGCSVWALQRRGSKKGACWLGASYQGSSPLASQTTHRVSERPLPPQCVCLSVCITCSAGQSHGLDPGDGSRAVTCGDSGEPGPSDAVRTVPTGLLAGALGKKRSAQGCRPVWEARTVSLISAGTKINCCCALHLCTVKGPACQVPQSNAVKVWRGWGASLS